MKKMKTTRLCVNFPSMNKTIIAVSGYAQAGKDTFADALTDLLLPETNTCRYKMAESLREAVGSAFAALRIERSAWTEIPEEKTLLRPLLVELGKYARAYDEDVFVNVCADLIEEEMLAYIQVALITDMRYHNEYLCLKALAEKRGWRFLWVHIVREGSSPANAEEEQSIALLRTKETPHACYQAGQGDTAALKRCAKDFRNIFLL